MMTGDDWRLFVQERLRALDPTLSLEDGSAAALQVVEPLVARLSPSLFETSVETFIRTRLQQEHPQLYADEGSALADLFAKPMLTLLEPIRREGRTLRPQQYLQDPSRLSAAEADALLANFFLTRNAGTYSKVVVRAFFRNALSVTVGGSNIAYTANGLRFLPVRIQSVTAESMLLNLHSSGLYYFDIEYQAERPGALYNVAASQVIGITGLSSAVRVTNFTASPGVDDESTTALVSRGESSLGERSANTLSGLVAVLRLNYPSLRVLQTIGFNDAEMHRDVLKGGGRGPVLASGVDGATVDDGDGDWFTPYFDSATGVFTTVLGPVGTDLSDYVLEVWYSGAPHEFVLGQVEGATQVRISTDYDGATALPDTLAGSFWTVRRGNALTLSDIPGGVLFPDVVGGAEVTVPADEVHVGGCADIYIRGGDVTRALLNLSLVSDEDVLARREDLRTLGGSDTVLLNDLTADEWSSITEGRSSVYIEEGADSGGYRVVEKLAGPGYSVRLSSAMAAPGVATNLSYLVVDDIDINLVAPRELRCSASDLRTVAGLADVQTVSGSTNFLDVGVVDTDHVRILSGDDAGEYTIAPGGVAALTITLDTLMTVTESPLAFEIYRKLDGIELPLLRVCAVELLDGNLNPTGAYVPYRHPVDVRSSSFQNPGREPKAGTDVVSTSGTYLAAVAGSDVVTAVDEIGNALGSFDWYAVGLRIGDLVNVETGDDMGFYTVVDVGGAPGSSLGNAYDLQLDRLLRWTVPTMEFVAGPPSYGSFRLYFTDPVTFEATYAETEVCVVVGSATRVFRPDPDIWHEYAPSTTTQFTSPLTPGASEVIPYTPDGGTNLDLRVYETLAGDRAEITYAPLVGSVDLAAGGPYNLDGQTLLIDVGDGDERVTFSGTALDYGVIVSQINSQLSAAVAAAFNNPATGEYYLMLRADRSITLRDNSAAAADATATLFGAQDTWNPWLPAAPFAGSSVDNDSPEKGIYLVSVLAAYPTGDATLTQLDGTPWIIDPLAGWSGSVTKELGHYLHLSRQGLQRVSSTAMEEQGTDEHGLYYFDLECISQGHGTPWNIADELSGTASGYYSEGWDVTTDDADTSYSTVEVPRLHLSPRVLLAGVEDDPAEKEELVGRSIQIAYERDPLVEQIQDFLREPRYRVLVSNPLVRSLLPTFVRTYIEYRGGGTVETVRTLLTAHITAVLPSNMLEVDALAALIRSTGPTKVTYPVTLVGLAHQRDRTIVTQRSVDQLSTDRLSALIPDTAWDGTSLIALLRTV